MIIVSIFISTIFIFSALFKLFSPYGFRLTIEALGFSKNISLIGVYFIIIYEGFVSIAILFEKTRVIASFSLLPLLAIFLISTWWAMRINSDASCNCFGDLSEERFGMKTIIRIAIIGVLDILIIVSKDPLSVVSISVNEYLSYAFFSVGLIILNTLVTKYNELKLTLR